MQALRDYLTNDEDESFLNFKKNDIIKLINNHKTQHTSGNHHHNNSLLLFGMLNNRHGYFPFDYVRPITRSEGFDSTNLNQPLFRSNENTLVTFTDRPLSYQQDGNYSMMEFAMTHFKQSIEK